MIVRNTRWKAGATLFALMVGFDGDYPPGAYVPTGIRLQWHAGGVEQQNHPDLCLVGDLHVPQCDPYQYAYISMELEDTAEIDGCSKWMNFWNDYLLPSLVLGRKEFCAFPIVTQAFYGTYSMDISLIMAALLLVMLPILIHYLLLQCFIVAGVTSGVVEG